MKRTLRLISLSISLAAINHALSATIPAGTSLNAVSTEPISTHERVGAPFKAQLAQDVVIKGNVVLRVGTPVVGVVEGSLRQPGSKGAVFVNVKSIAVNGHQVPVHTTGAYRLPPRFSTKRGVAVSGRETNYPHQTPMAFQLAQPLIF
jgi:hypothetical protein